jgi:hypothetical protein
MKSADFIPLSRFVASYRRKLVALRIVRAGLTVCIAFLVLLTALQVIFALFPWTVLPLVMDAAFFSAVLFVIFHAVITATVKAPGSLETARAIERRSDVERPFLSIALELSGDTRTRGNPFTGEVCSRAAAEIGCYPRSPGLPRRAAPAAAVAAGLCLLCLMNQLLSPRLLDYRSLPFLRLPAAAAVVSPGTIAVPQNEAVTLRLKPASVRFPSCRCMLFSPEGERQSSVLLRPDSGGAFARRIDSVRSSFLYRFSFAGSLTRTDTVTVVSPPRLERLSVTVRPPHYMRKKEGAPGALRALPEGQGNFEVYAGSVARFTVGSGRLARAALVRSMTHDTGRGSDTVPCALEGRSAACELTIDAPLDYRFALTDTFGQKNDSLPVFHIGCVPDEPPTVQIVKPGYSKDLEPEQAETLAIEGTDDIGVRSLVLRWRRPGRDTGGSRASREFQDLSDPAAPALVRAAFIWHITELSLYPGDTLFYWAEITDTKPCNPPQRGTSDTFFFRIPGFEEIHRKIVERTSAAERTIGAVRDRQAETENRLERVMKTLNGRKELSWEQKRILHDVASEFRAQADSLRAALESLRQNVEKMKQEGSVGEELAGKIDRVREAVDSLVKEYGDSLLFTAKDLERPVTLNDLRQAVAKLNAMLPRLDDQLDKVLKFLEMLKKDRKLAELAMRAERLSKEQAALSRSETDGRDAVERQKELLDRIRDLSRDAGAQSGAGDAGMDSLKSKAMVDSLQKTLRNSSGTPARSIMNRMSGALLSLSQDLMQMMSSREGLLRAKERERLLSLARDALTMSEWQDEILRDAAESSDEEESAPSQQALRDALSRDGEAADSLSMLSPEDMAAIAKGFTGARGASDRIIRSLGSGLGMMAMAGSAAALRSLAGTLLAAVANGDRQGQSSCSGGACMMPGLRRISGSQAALNSITADLLSRLMRGTKPGGGSAEGQDGEKGPGDALRAAQKAQAGIAEELRKLAEKYGREAGEGMRGRVDGLEEEAKRLAALLERPAPDIIERQDRFLARMLETTLSMHKEGEGKDEWKSRTAENIFGSEVPERPGAFSKDADSFHRLRQKAYRGNYPASYRSALRAYFDALSEKYLK